MTNAFLIKYAEIGIKGKNRFMFEDALIKQIKIALKKLGNFAINKEAGRIYVQPKGEYDFEDTVDALKRVFGIVGICPVYITEDKSYENIAKSVIDFFNEHYENKNFTFKVDVRRADKKYPIPSMEMACKLGEVLLNEFEQSDGLKVDVHKPDVLLNVEIRNKVYIYSKVIKGVGGMPLGTNGKAMLLLSGGIDSPVAGYMIAKRGVLLEATYFHSPPYTSERAKQKVIDLAKLVSKYAGEINLHIVDFTDIQLAIHEKCPDEELTIIMRRYMMRIAEHIAYENNAEALITGESIGQVASQTMKSLVATNDVCTMPVFRPLIGFDKQEIVEISEKIGTYETSILPYEDCCTIFVAKHPVTKPNVNVIRASEHNLDDCIEELMKKALDTVESMIIRP